jgi:hypothetical protein
MSSEFHHDDDGNKICSKGGLVKYHSRTYELEEGAAAIALTKSITQRMPIKFLTLHHQPVFGLLLIGTSLFMFAGLQNNIRKERIPKRFRSCIRTTSLYHDEIKFRPNIEEKHKNSALLADGIFF